jgi:hypothetical protein
VSNALPPHQPPADRRDALIREQAARLEAQAEQIAALEALVADLREQREAAIELPAVELLDLMLEWSALLR